VLRSFRGGVQPFSHLSCETLSRFRAPLQQLDAKSVALLGVLS
jgi:hypothetical protein